MHNLARFVAHNNLRGRSCALGQNGWAATSPFGVNNPRGEQDSPGAHLHCDADTQGSFRIVRNVSDSQQVLKNGPRSRRPEQQGPDQDDGDHNSQNDQDHFFHLLALQDRRFAVAAARMLRAAFTYPIVSLKEARAITKKQAMNRP